MNEAKKTDVQSFIKSCEFYITLHVHSSISIEIYRHQCAYDKKKKKRKAKVEHKRDSNYRFRFVLPFRKFLFILVTLWAQHYFRHHRYGSFADTAVRFSIRSNRCIAKRCVHREKYLCIIHEGSEFFVTLLFRLLLSSPAENSSIDVSRILYEALFYIIVGLRRVRDWQRIGERIGNRQRRFLTSKGVLNATQIFLSLLFEPDVDVPKVTTRRLVPNTRTFLRFSRTNFFFSER